MGKAPARPTKRFPTLLCFTCHNFPATYLLDLCDCLARGRRGNHSPIAPGAELKGQRQAGNQLHPEFCHAHFLIQDPDASLR